MIISSIPCMLCFSSFELVRSLLNPKKNHSPLLVQMANNSGCLSHTPSVLRKTEAASIFEDQLIWDTEPIKTEYFSTVGYDNKRIDISQLLHQKRINTGDQDTGNKTGNKSTSRGKLTILEYCTTESIVFESISDATPSDSDTKAKLTAIAVKCFSSKDRNSGTFLVKPLGGGEIILCAGACESPRILLSSGLGNVGNRQSAMFDSSSSEQKSPSICPVYLPGIGRNLQDHPLVPILCVGKWWGHESALTALKERLRKHSLEECSGSATDDALKKKKTVRGATVPLTSASVSASASLSTAVTFGVLVVTMIAGTY